MYLSIIGNQYESSIATALSFLWSPQNFKAPFFFGAKCTSKAHLVCAGSIKLLGSIFSISSVLKSLAFWPSAIWCRMYRLDRRWLVIDSVFDGLHLAQMTIPLLLKWCQQADELVSLWWLFLRNDGLHIAVGLFLVSRCGGLTIPLQPWWSLLHLEAILHLEMTLEVFWS